MCHIPARATQTVGCVSLWLDIMLVVLKLQKWLIITKQTTCTRRRVRCIASEATGMLGWFTGTTKVPAYLGNLHKCKWLPTLKDFCGDTQINLLKYPWKYPGIELGVTNNVYVDKHFALRARIFTVRYVRTYVALNITRAQDYNADTTEINFVQLWTHAPCVEKLLLCQFCPIVYQLETFQTLTLNGISKAGV